MYRYCNYSVSCKQQSYTYIPNTTPTHRLTWICFMRISLTLRFVWSNSKIDSCFFKYEQLKHLLFGIFYAKYSKTQHEGP